jgi:hypothetical protein
MLFLKKKKNRWFTLQTSYVTYNKDLINSVQQSSGRGGEEKKIPAPAENQTSVAQPTA